MHTSINALFFTALASLSEPAKPPEQSAVDAAVTRMFAGVVLVDLSHTCGWTNDEELLKKARSTVLAIATQGLPIEQKGAVFAKLFDVKANLLGLADDLAKDRAKAGECSSNVTVGLWSDLLKSIDVVYPPAKQATTPTNGKP